MLTIIAVARICHEANRALCESQGDGSQKCWDEAEGCQQESAVKGVIFALENPDATPEQQHDSWVDQKITDGWVRGPVKDVEKKTHPCICPYDQLPAEQQSKDHLFRGIVHALAPFVS